MESDPPVHLTSAQRQRLQDLLGQPNASPRVQVRVATLLMSARGVGGEEIARTLGITRRTVSNIRARWNTRGLRGLADRPRSGRPARADAAYRAALRHTVRRDPRTFGYAFTRWTAPRLAAHLARQTGIALSAPRVAALLRAADFVWRRTKLTLRNLQDADEVARARRMLLRLKKGRAHPAPGSSCGSAMA
jgi:transposase